MRQGDSDRDIDRSKIMGRTKLAAVREIATERGWLSPDNALSDATRRNRVSQQPARALTPRVRTDTMFIYVNYLWCYYGLRGCWWRRDGQVSGPYA